MGFHPHFNLPMARSSGFGFIAGNFTPFSDSLSLRLRNLGSLNLAAHNVSPAHFSIGTLSPGVYCYTQGFNCL